MDSRLVEARLVSIKDIKETAARRSRLHASHKTRRPLGEDYDFIGLMGQWEFAKQFGLKLDLSDKPAGDGRINFITEIGSVNVSTYRKPYNLLREAGKVCADYHVLARFSGRKTGWNSFRHSIDLLGWESDVEMLKCPTKDFGFDVVNHFKYVNDLRPMVELRAVLLGVGLQASLL